MELDDLRHQWREPEPAKAPLNASELSQLVARQSGSIVAKMRRNTWYEIIAAPLLGLLALLVAPSGGYTWVYVGLLSPLLVIMGFYYVRQLRLLRQMSQTDASLHRHLQVLCQGLRRMLVFYYRLTFWTATPTFLLLFGYTAWKELHRAARPHWLALGLIVVLGLLLGAWFQWGMLRFTRQFLQRLYGQHLDRLEGQLRELDEG